LLVAYIVVLVMHGHSNDQLFIKSVTFFWGGLGGVKVYVTY